MFIKTPAHYALRLVATFFPPQKPLVYSGLGAVQKLADLMVESGHKRPLLVTDGFLLHNNMLDDVLAYMAQAGLQVSIFSDITPNPTFAEVEAGLKVSKSNDCDSVLAIGGGSPLDAAKVIAAAHTNDKPLAKLAGNLKIKKPTLPFYAVPTTSGSGSETTIAAVISDTQSHQKRFFVSPRLIPTATALDPDLLKTLPGSFSAAVGMDALTHAIEAYTSTCTFEDSDQAAKLAIQMLFYHLPGVVENGMNLDKREKVALASFFAGWALTRAGLGYVHGISHQISAAYDTPHGVTNAAILPAVLRFNRPAVADKFAELEHMLNPQAGGTQAQLADQFIARVDALLDQIGLSPRLDMLRDEDFDKIAKDARAEAFASHPVPRRMSNRDVKAILRAAQSDSRTVKFS